MPNPEEISFENNVNIFLDGIRYLSQGAEFFLWEFVRNSSRALVQMRLESLVEKTALGTEQELFIKIVVDKENNSLSVIDTGIGMTKADLVNGLCCISDDALKKYMDTIGEREKNSNLSCLYPPNYAGLGFFSAFMVAEKVVITTRQNGHDQYVWESDGCGSFTIDLDTTGDRLDRGTKVTLFLEKDKLEYLDYYRLKGLVANYPFDICPYPISISEVGKRSSKRRRAADGKGIEDELLILKQNVKGIEDESLILKQNEDELLILKQKFEGLRKLFVKVLEGFVKNVVVSDRVYDLPTNLSVDKKTLEINPRSNKMEKLRRDAELNPKDEDVKARILLQYFAGCSNIIDYDFRHGTTFRKGPKCST